MATSNNELGKLLGIHGTSPAFLQRAAVVAVLSFLFFFALLIVFYMRQSMVYFLLSTSFLIVYMFTMVGWWLQKRNAIEVYENGLKAKDRVIFWREIRTMTRGEDGEVIFETGEEQPLSISRSIYAADDIAAFASRHLR